MTSTADNPFISVVIPTYNYGHFLDRVLGSLHAQEFEDIEVIIVDDASSDNTDKRVASWQARERFPIIYIKQPENLGPGAARNRGAEAARGEYLLFLDADDELLPDAFVRFGEAVRDNPQACLFIGGQRLAYPDGRSIDHFPSKLSADRSRNFRALVRNEISPQIGGVLLKRENIRNLRFAEDLRRAQDAVYFAHLLALCDSVSVHHLLVIKHRHADSLSHDWRRALEEMPRRIERLFDPRLLPQDCLALREEFETILGFTLFRTLHRAGADTEARRLYHGLIRRAPLTALKPMFLRKYLRGLLGIRHSSTGPD